MKELVWEDTMAGDRAVRIAEMDFEISAGNPMRFLYLEHSGTFAIIGSSMPRADLLKFAWSLRVVEKGA